MALHVAIPRLRQHRAFPERRRQRGEGDRLVEGLRGLGHLHRVIALLHQRRVDVEVTHARIRLEQVVHGVPLLSPHVAEQVRRDRLAGRHLVRAVLLREPAARVAVQLLVERLDLLVETRGLLGEVVRRHVVVRAPHGTQVLVAERACALVRQLGEAHVIGAQRPRRVVPTLPCLEQLVVVAALLEYGLELHLVAAGFRSLRAVLGRAVLRVHPRDQTGELGALLRIIGRRGGHAELQQLDRALRGRTHRLAFELLRLCDGIAERCEVPFVGLRGEELCVHGDVRGLRPAGGVDLEREVGELLVESRDELVGALGRGDGRGHGGEDGEGNDGANSRLAEGVSDHGNSSNGDAGRRQPPCCRGT